MINTVWPVTKYMHPRDVSILSMFAEPVRIVFAALFWFCVQARSPTSVSDHNGTGTSLTTQAHALVTSLSSQTPNDWTRTAVVTFQPMTFRCHDYTVTLVKIMVTDTRFPTSKSCALGSGALKPGPSSIPEKRPAVSITWERNSGQEMVIG